MLLAALFLTRPAGAQNYPELTWRVIETKHCKIYYHEGAQGTAIAIANIADGIVEKVYADYGRAPRGPFRILVRDTDDIANAHALYSEGAIDFYATASLFALRGRRAWVPGTFAHEFAHVVSLRANSMSDPLVEGFTVAGVRESTGDATLDLGFSLFVPTNIYWRWWAEAVPPAG